MTHIREEWWLAAQEIARDYGMRLAWKWTRESFVEGGSYLYELATVYGQHLAHGYISPHGIDTLTPEEFMQEPIDTLGRQVIPVRPGLQQVEAYL